MTSEEKAVIQSMFTALSNVVNKACPLKTGCFFCGIHDTCKRCGKLYREVEALLKESGETK